VRQRDARAQTGRAELLALAQRIEYRPLALGGGALVEQLRDRLEQALLAGRAGVGDDARWREQVDQLLWVGFCTRVGR
jgi:hypothetical protein